MEGIIYKYTNKLNGKVYIGQTINEYERRKQWLNPNNNYAGIKISNARKKYGIDVFDYCVIEMVDVEELDDREVYWISYYDSCRNGYNIDIGGGSGPKDRHLTSEHKKNISIGLKGHSVSCETREKIRTSNIGQKRSDEVKKKISDSHKGKTPWNKGISLSEETRRKKSESMKGKSWTLVDGKRIYTKS